MDRMKKKLMPLINTRPDMSIDASASYKVTDGGTLNLLSQSCGEYNINQLGLQKKSSAAGDDKEESKERTYQCASNEMCVFGAIGWGASSVVRKAIHIPTHRILALKKINVFEKEKRQQLLNEIRMLCEAPMAKGLVEFYGAFYSPDSGQISIALEYMDGGSLADIVRTKKFIPEPILSVITRKVLQGLNFLHGVRHLVHRDIKPANLLINLIGEPKITDFGISAGLDNSIAMCATFVGTVTYMSPERINNECYSYPADIWSLGLALLECGTGEFPYNASKGPVNLMLQVMYDPSPAPPADKFSSEFRSFVEACLRKEADSRPTAEQLLSHPFIKKYENADVDLAGFVHSVFDPTERLKDLSDMLTVHFYMLFDGPDSLWHHMKTFYRQHSTFSFANQTVCGLEQVYSTLTEIRNMLAGERPEERLVHVVENLQCCAYSKRGIMIRVSGAFVLGSHFIPTSDGIQVEGLLELRMLGKCPLTPEEAGLTLAALGFSQQTHVYLATYKVYGGEPRLKFLRNIFPLMHDKTSLLTGAELNAFKEKSSRLAALDYYVCLKSDFFFSASPGNMHNAMIGHRTYQSGLKTLKADMILLARLLANASMEWQEFRSEVSRGHRNRLGQVRLRQAKQSIYTYPAPDCMCKSNFKHL